MLTLFDNKKGNPMFSKRKPVNISEPGKDKEVLAKKARLAHLYNMCEKAFASKWNLTRHTKNTY